MARRNSNPTNTDAPKSRKPRTPRKPKAIAEAPEVQVIETPEPEVQTVEMIEVVATPEVDESAVMTIGCPKCQERHTFDKLVVVGKGGVKCPTCGFWLHVRLFPDLTRYVRGLGTTPSGNDTLDIADATADLLRGLALDDLYETVTVHLVECGKEAMSKSFIKEFGKDRTWSHTEIRGFLNNRYWERNPGMQRMNLGNILRSAMKRRSELNVAAK
jgi:hypothetical protein